MIVKNSWRNFESITQADSGWRHSIKSNNAQLFSGSYNHIIPNITNPKPDITSEVFGLKKNKHDGFSVALNPLFR